MAAAAIQLMKRWLEHQNIFLLEISREHEAKVLSIEQRRHQNQHNINELNSELWWLNCNFTPMIHQARIVVAAAENHLQMALRFYTQSMLDRQIGAELLEAFEAGNVSYCAFAGCSCTVFNYEGCCMMVCEAYGEKYPNRPRPTPERIREIASSMTFHGANGSRYKLPSDLPCETFRTDDVEAATYNLPAGETGPAASTFATASNAPAVTSTLSIASTWTNFNDPFTPQLNCDSSDAQNTSKFLPVTSTAASPNTRAISDSSHTPHNTISNEQTTPEVWSSSTRGNHEAQTRADHTITSSTDASDGAQEVAAAC